MMRPFNPDDIMIDDESYKKIPKLIRKPKKKKKHIEWYCYHKWWLDQQVVEIWIVG